MFEDNNNNNNNNNAGNKTSVSDKIRKLLNQAVDRAGTPEGDVFQAKAMELLARYGLTEHDVAVDDVNPQELITTDFSIPKKYAVQHHTLLTLIGEALGVYVVRHHKSEKCVLAGTRTNVERLKMLFDTLALTMTSGALKIKADADSWGPTTRQLRIVFMNSFSRQIAARLKEIENRVREEVEAEGVLVPVNEYNMAKLFFNKDTGFRVKNTRGREVNDQGAAQAGRESANNSDLGQQRFNGRLALA